MDNSLTFTLLGTGSSGGVPRVGNQWGNCDPENAKNRRRRCAMLIEATARQAKEIETTAKSEAKTTVLVDAGADLREQLLAANVMHMDGVLLTHSHADHIFGLDDLRQLALSMTQAIPVYMDDDTADVVIRSFNYIFHQSPNSSYPTFCTRESLEYGKTTTISGAGGDIKALPVLAEHGDIHALGFRIGSLAYLPDMKRMTDQASINALKGVKTLIVDALRYKRHPTHMNLEESLQFIETIRPNRAILTNMHTDLDYVQLSEQLPDGVEPGFDGMKISG